MQTHHFQKSGWFITKERFRESIKSEENETSLEEIIPFLYISPSVILKYREFFEVENV